MASPTFKFMTGTAEVTRGHQDRNRRAPAQRFARNAVAAGVLIVVLALSFGVYVRREEAVDQFAQARVNSFLLGEELRQSSNDLTRMARLFVVTRDTVYIRRFNDILAIREGRLPRPISYSNGGWYLHELTRTRMTTERQAPAALLDLMRGAGFTPREFQTIARAHAISDSLTATEFRAMELAAAGGGDRLRAIDMLHDGSYGATKAAIMDSIGVFLAAVDQRTLAAVNRAQAQEMTMRWVFAALGILLLITLWRTYAALRGTMGGSVTTVHRRIKALGSGDAPETREEKGPPNSVLGWLSEADARLADTMRERAMGDERMRAVVESALDCIISMGADGRVIEFNPAAERTLGYRRADVLGKSLASLIIPPRFRDAHEAGLRRYLATGTGRILGQRIEMPALRADGTEILVELAITRIGSETPAVFTGFLRDISDRKRDEERLRQLASLLDHAQDAIILRTLDNRITFWNEGAARLYGWSAGEVMGRSALALFYKDPGAFNLASERVTKDGLWVGELDKLVKDGGICTVESRWTLVRDAAGTPTSVMVIETDITDRKDLEQQFLRAQRVESIGTLAGGIAHDLNNVLAPIMMSIDLLRQTVTGEEDQELLDAIAISAKRGAEMVSQVLSFARGMGGRRIAVRAKHLIGDVERIVTDTFPKNIDIRTLVRPDMWTIVGDPTQLQQVLLNLCVNARDAMPDGGQISITAENTAVNEEDAGPAGAAPGNYVCIEVEDTGVGIAPNVLGRIFDPFFTTKEIGKGTGLGLSTSLGIVTSHGGSLRVDSQVGRGTRFRILLPAQVDAPSESAELREPAPIRGNGETILVVDDEASIRQITAQTLEAFGYRVLTAADGAEAIAIYAEQHDTIAVVLTDMMMPVLDGASTIQVLLRMNPEVRIIAASGGTANRALASDSDKAVMQFLSKPFTAETLLAALQAVLSRR